MDQTKIWPNPDKSNNEPNLIPRILKKLGLFSNPVSSRAFLIMSRFNLVPMKRRACTWKFINTLYRMADRNHTYQQICLRCKTPDTITHCLIQCPKAIFFSICVFKFFNLSLCFSGSVIDQIANFNSEETAESISNRLAISIILWVIHTNLLDELNSKTVMTDLEMVNRIRSAIVDILFSYYFSLNWLKKLKPILMQIVEQNAIVNLANSSVLIRSDFNNTLIRNHIEFKPCINLP